MRDPWKWAWWGFWVLWAWFFAWVMAPVVAFWVQVVWARVVVDVVRRWWQ